MEQSGRKGASTSMADGMRERSQGGWLEVGEETPWEELCARTENREGVAGGR